jgi:hypothetical protein
MMNYSTCHRNGAERQKVEYARLEVLDLNQEASVPDWDYLTEFER